MQGAGKRDSTGLHRCHSPRIPGVDTATNWSGKCEYAVRQRRTRTMPNSSILSLASSFVNSKSMVLAWFLDAVDCSLRLRDMIAAVCDAAVADSLCAVCVCARKASSSLHIVSTPPQRVKLKLTFAGGRQVHGIVRSYHRDPVCYLRAPQFCPHVPESVFP